ncbi:MAG: GNAT family N-acetyltransferase [Alphaproteobacteria bacterium]|nr:GNAT family N-acetyltransferase [Alphaproteobacteria bacterium]
MKSKFNFANFSAMPGVIIFPDFAKGCLITLTKTLSTPEYMERQIAEFDRLLNRPDVRQFAHFWHKDTTGSQIFVDDKDALLPTAKYFKNKAAQQDRRESYGYHITLANGRGESRLIGYTVVWGIRNGLAEICCFLDPSYSRYGRGPAVIKKLKEQLKECGIDKFALSSHTDNKFTMTAATAAGYEFVGIEKNFKGDPMIAYDIDDKVVRLPYDRMMFADCPEQACAADETVSAPCAATCPYVIRNRQKVK